MEVVLLVLCEERRASTGEGRGFEAAAGAEAILVPGARRSAEARAVDVSFGRVRGLSGVGSLRGSFLGAKERLCCLRQYRCDRMWTHCLKQSIARRKAR